MYIWFGEADNDASRVVSHAHSSEFDITTEGDLVGVVLVFPEAPMPPTREPLLPPLPSRAVFRTSKNTGCLRLQPTGFNTLNHDAKILQSQRALSVSGTFRHFPSRFGVICHFPSLFVTFCYFSFVITSTTTTYEHILRLGARAFFLCATYAHIFVNN